MIFVIEHLEPELYDWCMIEYEHISSIVGKEHLIFTNIKVPNKKLSTLGKIHSESIATLQFTNACVLDPEAKKTLTHADTSFEYLILGGILGDDPPRARTKGELSAKLPYPTRNLGKDQFATDTAVKVAQKLLAGKKLSELSFVPSLEIETGDGESVVLPFKYLVENGSPCASKKLVEYLKTHDGF